MSARRDLASATFSDTVNGVFTLAPQTTPYSHAPPAVATGGSGANNNKCNSRSVFCFTTAGQLSRGYACDLVDGINADNYQYLDGDCYPPHYNLINHGGTHATYVSQTAEHKAYLSRKTEPNLDRTVAYPGTACPAGFTPACTTTLTLTNPSAKPSPYTGTLTQTWCCPRGNNDDDNAWVCTDRDQFPQQPTSRLCVNVIAGSAPTNVWFSAGSTTVTAPSARSTVTTTSSVGGSSYTTSAVGPDMSIRVLRAAFPLGEVSQDVLRGLAGSPPEAANEGTSSKSAASPGMIAGIVLGCLALLGFIAVGIYLCVRYKREGKEERTKQFQANLEAATDRVDEKDAKSTADEAKVKPETGQGVDSIELPVPVLHLPYGRLSEMSSDSGVAELPVDDDASRMERTR